MIGKWDTWRACYGGGFFATEMRLGMCKHHQSSTPVFMPPPACFADLAPQISSTLRSKHADYFTLVSETSSELKMVCIITSIAVLILCSLTASGSQTPYFLMSTISPVSPLIPQLVPPSACFVRSLVRFFIGFAPAFWMSVRGMTSIASATARYGHC